LDQNGWRRRGQQVGLGELGPSIRILQRTQQQKPQLLSRQPVRKLAHREGVYDVAIVHQSFLERALQ
jgi:hypothetical protein